jgi:hypothetical protein
MELDYGMKKVIADIDTPAAGTISKRAARSARIQYGSALESLVSGRRAE